MTTATKERPAKADAKDAAAAIIVADRADMLRAAQVASVVDSRNTIPILANMLIEASGDGLAMTATDLDIQVRVAVPGRCEGVTFCTTVAAKRFAALLGAADEGCQIKLKHDVGGRDVELSAAKGRYKLPTQPRDDFPLIAFSAGPRAFELSAKLLAATLARTSPAESVEVNRYYLKGTLLAVRDGQLLAVATNGHIMAEIALGDAPADWPDVILPSKLTALLVRLMKDGDGEVGVVLNEGGGQIRFDWGDWTITSKLIVGTYPDWRRVIPSENVERRVLVDSAILSRAVQRVTQVASERTRAVVLTMGRDQVTVSCSSIENGEGEEDVAASCEIDDLRIGMNAAYLRDMVAAASGDTVAFDFGDARGPVRVMPAAGAGFVGVIMPMNA